MFCKSCVFTGVKYMLHVLYIIINISCPRKRIKNRGMQGPYVNGVNRRSENFLLLSDLLFA